jgi:hypothetical protein
MSTMPNRPDSEILCAFCVKYLISICYGATRRDRTGDLLITKQSPERKVLRRTHASLGHDAKIDPKVAAD